MTYEVRFELGQFQRGVDPRKLAPALGALLRALFEIDCAFLRQHPETPRLYQSDVRYLAEPYGVENWRDIPRVLEAKNGDCEDLACWQAAERVVKDGLRCRPIFRWRTLPNGTRLYHIMVLHPNGSVEDPSLRLGMPRHQG